jgi:hypothetical protein
LIDEKTDGRKSRDMVPLKTTENDFHLVTIFWDLALLACKDTSVKNNTYSGKIPV